jgi:hypothetical protein
MVAHTVPRFLLSQQIRIGQKTTPGKKPHRAKNHIGQKTTSGKKPVESPTFALGMTYCVVLCGAIRRDPGRRECM